MTTLKRLALKSLMFDYRFSLMPHVKYIEQTLAISQQFLLQTIGGDNISLSHFEFKWFTTVNLYVVHKSSPVIPPFLLGACCLQKA